MAKKLISLDDAQSAGSQLPSAVRDEIGAFGASQFAPLTLLGSRYSVPVPQPDMTFVTRFQSGHGWISSGSGTADLNHAESGPTGSQFVRMTTNGVGAGLIVKNDATPTSFDASDRVAILMRVDDITRINGVQLYVGNDSSNYNIYTALHFTSQDAIMPGEWSWIYVTAGDKSGGVGTPDMSACNYWRVRAADQSTGALNVDIAAIATFPTEEVAAGGVCTFTFDDGYISHYERARPMLARNSWQASLFPICSVIGTSANYMTVEQMQELQNLYRWDIGAHAFDSAKHANGGYPNWTLAEAEADILANLEWLLANGFKWTGAFAWPGGGVTPELMTIAQKYFSIARSSAEKPKQTPLPDTTMNLRSFSVNYSRNLATYQAEIDLAQANDLWINFRIHDIVSSGADSGTEIDESVLQGIVDYVASSGIKVRTNGQVLRAVA